MNIDIDKCTEEALKVLNKDRYKEVRKRNRVVALVAAFLVMVSTSAFPVYAVKCNIADGVVSENGEIVYTTDWLNVREEPEFGDNIIDVVAPNTGVEFRCNIGEWSEVIYDGKYCYMYTYYLSPECVGDIGYDLECDIGYDLECGGGYDDVEYGSGYDIECDSDYDDYDNVEYDFGTGFFDAYFIDDYITAEEFRNYGIVNYNGECFTYYSELVLPGGGLDIPGRYTDWDGYVCDEEGYVVLATPNEYTHPRGSIIELPTGRMGKFYDFCPEGNIDVYVGW